VGGTLKGSVAKNALSMKNRLKSMLGPIKITTGRKSESSTPVQMAPLFSRNYTTLRSMVFTLQPQL
jgi:hypothetical protein